MATKFTEFERDAILTERIKKENQAHIVSENFTMTPGQAYVYAEKPTQRMSDLDAEEILARAEHDPMLKNLIDPLKPPTEKYRRPITSNHAYGWHSKTLVEPNPLFEARRTHCEVTKIGEALARHAQPKGGE
eukprot:TRINITY_DN3597_c0_g2_i12.p1 TRINITY_DN3597_c0_g2~~TRINITY_DN3597_c0_g2_i12.p1  ORF type:complete len:132 (+),score=13.18 TRINITY_DN3597_c0_g2_i12:208-603(+)